jgi:hypothetical protein
MMDDATKQAWEAGLPAPEVPRPLLSARDLDVVYVNADDPEFAFLMPWYAAGWEIADAPRPLLGTETVQGPFRSGVFYAGLDPTRDADLDMAGIVRRNWRANNATPVVVVTNDDIKDALSARLEEADVSVEEMLAAYDGWSGLARMDGWPWYG